jgi:hypothetical protein
VHLTDEQWAFIQPRQRVLQDMAVDGRMVREVGADVFSLGLLLDLRDGDAQLLPGDDTLLKRRVAERAAYSKHAPKRPSCSGVGSSLCLYVLRTVCSFILLSSA